MGTHPPLIAHRLKRGLHAGVGRVGLEGRARAGASLLRSGVVKVRWSPYWAVTAGRGCVERGPRDWTRVRVEGGGPIRVTTRFSPTRIRAEGARCR